MAISKLFENFAEISRHRAENTRSTEIPTSPKSNPLLTPPWKDGFERRVQMPLYAANQAQNASPLALYAQDTPSAPPGVTGTYNVTTGELTLIDPNRIDPKTGKPMEITGQFFSGMPNTTSSDPDGPIPDGTYDILYHPDENFFRLESVDNSYGDDAVRETDRGELRLHRPGGSFGCVTAEEWDEWNAIKPFIEAAQTDKVDVDSKSSNPFKNLDWVPGRGPSAEELVRYGRIEVISNPPEIPPALVDIGKQFVDFGKGIFDGIADFGKRLFGWI